jgi:sec-independent protein translocase protein TatA
MPSLGPTELVIILVLALVLFGAGKLADVGGALGKSIKEFRHAATDEQAPKPKAVAEEPTSSPQKIS